MKIIVAKDAGYCFGVRHAVDQAYKTAKEHGDVYMLGHIVHNENVVKDLEKSGTQVVDSLDQVPAGKPLLFRAHGTEPIIWEQARKKQLNIIDATCPLVTEIHEEVRKLEEEGRQIIIIGDHGHDEIIGISTQVKSPIVISNAEEAQKLKKIKRVGVVSQSTQMIENIQDIISVLLTKVSDLHFVNTICFPTKRNHEQIKKLAQIADVMIIIGSFTSANSKRLTQLALERNSHSYQVTNVEDIQNDWFINARTVGISAGASTPDNIIQNVIQHVKKIGNVNEKEIIYE
ncbi:4-hydroxy-3-methylbut-2-enyl diphosphate reductase [bacterium]|nr:4-hydroxy-3-methylbut-2-enyl diphosphate reductase [bacterium]